MLACWVPDTYGWSLELEGYMRFALLVENAHLLNLTLVEDNSIFCESLLVYFPDTLVGFYGFLSLTVDASAYVTIETNTDAGRTAIDCSTPGGDNRRSR